LTVIVNLLGRCRNYPDQVPEDIGDWHADVLAQPARLVMISRHERASAVRIAVNSNMAIVMLMIER
jgi:hypothetical protein